MSLHLDRIKTPVLAVDMGERMVRMLLYSPSAGGAYEFASPSPLGLLAGAVARATKAGQGVYRRTAGPGDSLVAALQAHREAGLGLAVHPEAAETLFESRAGFEQREIRVSEEAPSDDVDDVIIDIPGVSGPEPWLQLIRSLGLESPEQLLLCAPRQDGTAEREGVPAESGGMEELFAQAGERGLAPESLFSDKADGGILRLWAIGRNVNVSAMDRSFAFAAGMLSLSPVAARSRREGVLLLHAGRRRLTAALVFQERLFSLLEMPLDFFTSAARPGDIPGLAQRLDDFRLGWLPSESARVRGGLVCRSQALPPEAEGFRPAFITGENAFLLAQYGQELKGGLRGRTIRCRGLLWAFERAQACM